MISEGITIIIEMLLQTTIETKETKEVTGTIPLQEKGRGIRGIKGTKGYRGTSERRDSLGKMLRGEETFQEKDRGKIKVGASTLGTLEASTSRREEEREEFLQER